MKPHRFEAVGENGKIYRRSSQNRHYTHCVVIHLPGYPAVEGRYGEIPPHVETEWAGSEALALRNASRHRNKGYKVEILVAVEQNP